MKRMVLVYLFAACIPLLLMFDVYQSKRFTLLERDVRDIENRQVELVESNKKLLSGISVLSNPDRIEKIALESLHMRRALPSEILRIEIKERGNGG
ncbi:MAG: cell division protein FtsL [Spirochaetaceae bacterium]|nr:cell division protein FtsL [Spirochaetaceae bacterium]